MQKCCTVDPTPQNAGNGSSSSALESEDSDWVPEEKGGEKEEEEEDVAELVADAEGFIQNKKMRR